MKQIQLEAVSLGQNAVSTLDEPRLCGNYYWHRHPEIELAFIETDRGIRKVGQHESRFSGREVCLIGSNIPHLNFDFLSTEPYQHKVVQLSPKVFELISFPFREFDKLKTAMQWASYGASFTVDEVDFTYGQRIIDETGTRKLNLVLEFLEVLVSTYQPYLLHAEPFNTKFIDRNFEKWQSLISYIEVHFAEKLQVDQVARACSMSKATLNRVFQTNTQLNFNEFLHYYRLNHAKKLLNMGKTVSEACFESGYDNPAYFSTVFKKIEGISPKTYKK